MTNPHKEFSRQWIEWEDQQWRELITTGAIHHYAKRIANDHQKILDGKRLTT